MNPNEQLITRFYQAFKNKDHKTMQDCYAGNATFSDEVFVKLNARQVRGMWEMFCVNGQDLTIDFTNVKADDYNGSAEWTASYTFTRTGRKVVNHVHAIFMFKDGKIVSHKDHFDFYKWLRQALGPAGLLFGWTPMLKNKVRVQAERTLQKYLEKSGS